MLRTTLILIIISLQSSVGFSHSGRTDSQGGHYNRKTGEYHFHNGDDFEKYPDKNTAYYRHQAKEEKQKENDRLFWNVLKYGAIGLGGIYLVSRIRKKNT